jgi:hypothetical protein
MMVSNPKAVKYLEGLDIKNADVLDKTAWDLLVRRKEMERVAAWLERKLSLEGEVEALDRGGRKTKIIKENGLYWVRGGDGQWYKVDEAIWAYAMAEAKKKCKTI